MQKNCKKIAKKLQKSCKKIAKKLQKSCKNFAKNLQNFCRFFAEFLQFLQLHILQKFCTLDHVKSPLLLDILSKYNVSLNFVGQLYYQYTIILAKGGLLEL